MSHLGHPAVHADRRGARAAADRRRGRGLRRARLVPEPEAVHRRRGRRAGRGQRALLRRRARPRRCRCARRSWPTGSRPRATCSGTTTTSTTRRRPGRELLRKPLIGAVAAAAGPGRRDPGVPVDADLQAADRRRAEQHRAVALRQALLVVVARRTNMLTAFIPFHDCGEEMGTITMVDGSHRWKEIGREDTMTRHFAERDNGDLERVLAENAAYNNAEVVKVPMVIPKGHMSFHHCRTYHGSGANRSAAPAPGRSRSTCRTATTRTARSRSATASLVAYNHDVLVRRTARRPPRLRRPRLLPRAVAQPEPSANGHADRRLTCPVTTGASGTPASTGWRSRSARPATRSSRTRCTPRCDDQRRDPDVPGAPRLRRVGLHVAAEVAAAQPDLRRGAVGADRPDRQPPADQRHRAGRGERRAARRLHQPLRALRRTA